MTEGRGNSPGKEEKKTFPGCSMQARIEPEEDSYREDMEGKFPGLIDRITAHPSVGLTVSRLLDKSIVIAGKEGSIIVKADGTTGNEGKDPLSSYGDSAFLAQRILVPTMWHRTIHGSAITLNSSFKETLTM